MIKVEDIIKRVKLILNDPDEMRYGKNVIANHFNIVQDDLYNESVTNRLDLFRDETTLTMDGEHKALLPPLDDNPVADVIDQYGEKLDPIATYTRYQDMSANYYIADGYLYSDRPSVTLVYYERPMDQDSDGSINIPSRMTNLVARLVCSHITMQYEVYRQELIFFKRGLNSTRISHIPDRHPFR